MLASTIESSLVGTLTDTNAPSRAFGLSQHCGVIVLSRVIRSLNLTRAETLDELYTRRESAAVLASLRMQIQNEVL